MNFVLKERLGWDGEDGMKPEGRPFEKEEDIKVLWNDWPYGIDERIVHLVVWTKFELEDDLETNDLTDQTRGEIEKYVEEKFRRRCGSENVSYDLFRRGLDAKRGRNWSYKWGLNLMGLKRVSDFKRGKN